MKILCTGIAGFIGSHVAKALIKRGDTVVGIDSLNDYYSPEYKRLRLTDFLGGHKFDFYQGDINSSAFEELFEKYQFDKVIHLAAQAGVRYSLEHPQVYIDTNITGFNNVLELMVKYKVQDLIFASSSSVYGAATKMPLSENMLLDKPLSLYAASKIANEAQAHAYHYLYGLNCWGLRFFNVYGPWGRPDSVIYKFLKLIEDKKPIELYNQGKHKRDFTYIDDLVKGVLAAVDRVQGYEVINLASDRPMSIEYMVDVLEIMLGKEVAKLYVGIQKGDVIKSHANVAKAKRLLGYNPSVSFESGLRQCFEWFKIYKNVL